MSSRMQSRLLAALTGCGLFAGSGMALADYALNMTRGVTPISQDVYDLHMLIFWICVVIGIVVFGAMFISIISHRKSKGAVPAQFHESTTVEIIWTVIPFLILIGMAIPATHTLIAMEDTSDAEVTIKITAYQWKWRYDYVDEDFGFFSTLDADSNKARQLKSGINPADVDNYLLNVDNALVVPVNKKVRFLITSSDVIHAWWVPALGTKKDAIPGFVNEMWATITEPGTYRGQCAELCGKDHGFMPIVVIAKSDEDYAKWLAEQKGTAAAAIEDPNKVWSHDELMAKGESLYNANCAACHQANGEGVEGVFKALKGSPIATGPLVGHLDIVMHGKAGTAMQAFASQLSDTDLAAIITYERNAWGNATGDTIQPADIKAVR